MSESSAAESSAATAAATSEDLERTPEQLAEAHRYGQLELICSLADKFIDVAFLSFATFVLARPLDRWLSQFVARDALRLPLLFLLVFVMHLAISFPLSC